MKLADLDPRKVALETARRIREYPETYEQTQWLCQNVDEDGAIPEWDEELNEASEVPTYFTSLRGYESLGRDAIEWSDCGTAACVAGHAAAVALDMIEESVDVYTSISTIAAEALGFVADPKAASSGVRLFDQDNTTEQVLEVLDQIAAGTYAYETE